MIPACLYLPITSFFPMERYRITTTTYIHTKIYTLSPRDSLSLLCRIGSEGEVGRGIPYLSGEVGRGGEGRRGGKGRYFNIQQQQQQQNSFRYVYTTKGPRNQSIGSLLSFAWFVEQGRAGQSRAWGEGRVRRVRGREGKVR